MMDPSLGGRGRAPWLLRPFSTARRREHWAQGMQLGPATVFLFVFLIAPMVVFLCYSFWRVENFDIVRAWGFSNYVNIFTEGIDLRLLRNTLVIAGITSVVTVLIAYTYAYIIRFYLRRWQEPLLLLVLVALFSGYLVRIYAWRTILGEHGIINDALQRLGIIDNPLSFLIYSRTAAIIVLCNFLVPLAILPIYAALQNVGDTEVEAARDLGCGPFQAMWRVVLPLAHRGVFGAFALSFIIATGDYVTPQLVGGVSGTMVGLDISNAFLATFDWPRGAALSFVTLLTVLVILGLVWRLTRWVWR
jgi:spermidine/putrescine transport system permease protein